MPSFSYRYTCVRCATPQTWGAIRYRCHVCGQNLRIQRKADADSPSAMDIVTTFRESETEGMWRYVALLPVEAHWGSRLRVGGTPLIDCGDDGGVRLRIKDEARNPSGSLKDRATELVLAVAKRAGCKGAVTASTGNAGASLACIAAAQAMTATVVVPASTPFAKLAQIRAYGANVCEIGGTYDDAFEIAERMADDAPVCCRNTGVNPFTREGKKTCAYEIAEAMAWHVPDWVIVPTGDGNILSGIAAGFLDLFALGITSAIPRLMAAQASSADSIARDWTTYDETVALPVSPTAVTPNTVADSLSVSRPRDHFAALHALRATRGTCVVVNDECITAASRTLAQRFGLWYEPSTAAGYAALQAGLASGRIQTGEEVVLLGTGSGLKSPQCFDGVIRPPASALAVLPEGHAPGDHGPLHRGTCP
ncbi:pyridoxal-phosphate dependent enzyme [Pandoraea sputorum]|uniref:threonine synthase n=1 Tax=Pandoraea sputorum TaxID=93222 RepID=UPI001E62E959|nr:pyridoxal-phosphate dependent enzyme [Pandoraea sputorum]MCE4060856.1 pyridoxal-phosphate dependent enzyme [Pandoraea sputorum]